MVAIPLQAAALRRHGIAWLGSSHADHTDLRDVLEGSLLIWGGAVGELPDADTVVPAAPVMANGPG